MTTEPVPQPDRWINVRVRGVVREACEERDTTPEAVIEEAFEVFLHLAQADRTRAERAARLQDTQNRYARFFANNPIVTRPTIQWGDTRRWEPLGYTTDNPEM